MNTQKLKDRMDELHRDCQTGIARMKATVADSIAFEDAMRESDRAQAMLAGYMLAVKDLIGEPEPADKQPCGHPTSAIAGNAEGMRYCANCAADQLAAGSPAAFGAAEFDEAFQGHS